MSGPRATEGVSQRYRGRGLPLAAHPAGAGGVPAAEHGGASVGVQLGDEANEPVGVLRVHCLIDRHRRSLRGRGRGVDAARGLPHGQQDDRDGKPATHLGQHVRFLAREPEILRGTPSGIFGATRETRRGRRRLSESGQNSPCPRGDRAGDSGEW